MLNPERAVILLAEREGRRVLVGFHPEPGNYEVHLPPGFRAEPGSRWEFMCPVCHQRLITDETDELCALDLEMGGEKHRLFFTPVAGDEATFVISAEGIRSSYGADFKKYLREVGWGPLVE
jgi:hypothetical protein